VDVAVDAGDDARHLRARLRRPEPVRRVDGDLVLRCEHVRGLRPLRRRDGPDDPSTDPPIVTTTDGGHDLGAANEQQRLGQLPALDLVPPGTHTCTAVGRGGSIVTTTDLATWTKATRTRRAC